MLRQPDEGYKTSFKGYAEPEVVTAHCFQDGGKKIFQTSAEKIRAKDWHDEAKEVAARMLLCACP